MTEKSRHGHQHKLMIAAVLFSALAFIQQSFQLYSLPAAQSSISSPQTISFLSVGVIFISVTYLLYRGTLEFRRTMRLAYCDELTGLPNRCAFDRQLTETIELSRKQQTNLAIAYFDLDKFKNINDSYGHDAGDSVIQEFARRLKVTLREQDYIARLSGDEFATILIDVSDAAEIETVLSRIFLSVKNAFLFGERKIYAGVSIGACWVDKSQDDPTTIVKQADFALRQAKDSGRNTLRIFDPSMAEYLDRRGQLESELRRAIVEEALDVHYQPVVSAKGVTGVEALIRWENSALGSVPPTVFVPVAQDLGLIDELGVFVLRRACTEIGQIEHLRLAVNISPTHFLQRNFVNSIQSVLAETNFDPRRLEIEITEGVFMNDPKRAKDAIIALQEIGVRIALDDFGTGYSGMSYLRDFPVDRIKIDRSFLENNNTTRDARELVLTMIQLGRTLGLNVTVEGVELEDQLKFLSESGCSDMQGFLFSKPIQLETLKAVTSTLAAERDAEAVKSRVGSEQPQSLAS